MSDQVSCTWLDISSAKTSFLLGIFVGQKQSCPIGWVSLFPGPVSETDPCGPSASAQDCHPGAPDPGLVASGPRLPGFHSEYSPPPPARPGLSRCWQKWEPSEGLADGQGPVCLEQPWEPGGHFFLQGPTAQPSHREHTNRPRLASE